MSQAGLLIPKGFHSDNNIEVSTLARPQTVCAGDLDLRGINHGGHVTIFLYSVSVSMNEWSEIAKAGDTKTAIHPISGHSLERICPAKGHILIVFLKLPNSREHPTPGAIIPKSKCIVHWELEGSLQLRFSEKLKSGRHTSPCR